MGKLKGWIDTLEDYPMTTNLHPFCRPLELITMGEARNRRRRGLHWQDKRLNETAPVPAEKLIEIAQSKRELPQTGFKGKVNIYCCDDCHGFIVTKDVDEGVTPFMIKCQQSDGVQCADNCKGYMKSAFYRVPHAHMNHTHEWHSPVNRRNVPQGLLDHVSRGGLLLRKVGKTDE